MDSTDSNLIEFFLCGGMGGIWTVLVGHPFDTVKVRLQTMPAVAAGKKPLFTGMFDCFRQTVKHEGPGGLFKGMMVPLLSITPVFAISFSSYRLGKEIFGKNNPNMSPISLFLAGAFAGGVTTLVMSPVEKIKCMLQIQREKAVEDRKFSGPIQIIRAELAARGIAGIYQGFLATLCRDVPGAGVYFLTYEIFSRFETTTWEGDLLKMIVGGGMAGVLMWAVVLPVDVVKSRLQVAPPGTYTGMAHALTHLLSTEGPMALYRGAVPVAARAFPANAACFLGFEFCNKQIIQRFKKPMP